jgi:hypothetical protein
MLHSVAARSHKLRRTALAGVVAAGMMVAGAMAVHAPSANAGVWDKGAQGADSWSIVEEIGAGLHAQGAHAHTTSSVCVGPIQKSGGGYVAPYGWGCHAGGEVEWEYGAITAFPAFYNPNPNEVREVYGWSYF